MKFQLDKLYSKLIKDEKYSKQLREILDQNSCDIDGTFLGFVDTYEHLAKIIPHDWTIIDLGCAYACQAYYFLKHKQYIGVDISDCKKLQTPNSIYYQESIKDFLVNHIDLVKAGKTFAICNYVPPWAGGSSALLKEVFDNIYIFYPQR
jgi:hypothetical protein